MKKTACHKIFLSISLACIFSNFFVSYSQNISIQNHSLKIEINSKLQTLISTEFKGTTTLMGKFSSSEYLATKYFTAKDFAFTKKENHSIDAAAGKGVEWIIDR